MIVLQIFCYLIVGVIFALLPMLFFSEKQARLKWPLFVMEFFRGNSLTLLLMQFVLLHTNVMYTEKYTWLFSLEYCVVGLVGCLLVSGAEALLRRSLGQDGSDSSRKSPQSSRDERAGFRKSGLRKMQVTLGLITFFVAMSVWHASYFGTMIPESVIVSMQLPLSGSSPQGFYDFFAKPVCLTMFLVFSLGIAAYSHERFIETRFFRFFAKWRNWVVTLLCLVTGAASFYSMGQRLQLFHFVEKHLQMSTFIEDRYTDVRQTHPTFPEHKRNFIHIFLESVENSYSDQVHGGYMQEDLIPELTKIAEEGISFSHTQTLGGPYQTHGSGWSAAAIVNMTAGVPMKVADDWKAYSRPGAFFPGLYSLGDLLQENGYEQELILGTDASFGGFGSYYTEHGGAKIFDLKEAKREGLLPEDYNVWWGFEDEKLYTYARMELTRLAATGKPFHLVMETADTHFPDGYLQPGAPQPYEGHYANVIHYSQAEAAKFIRWIQAQDFYENTTILITGDHHSMDKKFFEDFDPVYQRTIYNVFFNPCPEIAAAVKENKGVTQNRLYAPFDFYPTIVASLGINFDGDRLGLGTNLFSGQKTLIEVEGYEFVEAELEKNSEFYQNRIIKDVGQERATSSGPDKT